MAAGVFDLGLVAIYDADMMRLPHLVFAALLVSSSMGAQEYSAKNVAMGGTGVASADYLNAGFVNPALITRFSHEDDDDWGLLLPSVGAFITDPESLMDDLQDFEDSFSAIETAWDGGSAPTQTQLDTLAASIRALDGQSLQLRAFAGASIAIPSDTLAMSLVLRGDLDSSGFLLIDDADATAIENALTGGSLPTMGSEAVILAAGIAEVGLALAHETELWGHSVSFGATPKFQRIDVYNYAISIEQAGDANNDFDSSVYRNDDTAINLDLGAHVQLEDGFSVGLAVRDMIEQDLLTPTTNSRNYTYSLSPVLTTGVAYQWDFLTVAADVDLSKRKGFSNTDGTQFLRFGVESGWTWGQLRAGYSKDIQDTRESVFTAGVGFSPFGVLHLDVAGALGENSYGGVVALSFTF